MTNEPEAYYLDAELLLRLFVVWFLKKDSERYLLATYPQVIYCESSPSVEGSWKEVIPISKPVDSGTS